MQNDAQPNDQSGPANLPALLPPATLLLQRTQTTLGLMHDVVQESSADFWFHLAWETMRENRYEEALYFLSKGLKLDFEWQDWSTHIMVCEFFCYKHRSKTRALQGDLAGSLADQKEADERRDFCEDICDVNG